MAHRLDPLLRPASIAVLGASDREDSVGRTTIDNLLAGGYEGELYAVNPGRSEVLGVPCYPGLDALPATAEHVVFCIADHRVEAAIEQVIAHGAKAITLMSQLIVEGDPKLSERIQAQLAASPLLVCGPNGMGFYNGFDGVWVCGFDTRQNHVRGGNVSLISHSGSGMAGIVDCEERIDFNLAVSTGSEWSVGMAEYLDFAIEQHHTRAVGLFMETARDPQGLIQVLEKANTHQIPIVAIKVGRTELSASLAQSHSGAMAGEDAAYQALFDRYGVQRVEDMHEMTAALMLFAQPHPVGAGGIATLHDSGGERQLLIDLAERLGTPLAEITPQTKARLEALLDPGLPPVNPLDAWGAGGPNAHQIMIDCMAALMEDPNVALGAVVHDRGPFSNIYTEYLDYMRGGHETTGKPMCLVSNYQGSGHDPQSLAWSREGYPVLDGIRPFLVASKAVLAYRDFLQRPQQPPQTLSTAEVNAALHTLPPGPPNELDCQRFLATLGLPANPCQPASSEAEAVTAAAQLGYPLVMKTLRADIAHKTEHGGVHLNLHSEAEVRAAWQALNDSLGPEVLLAPMVQSNGLEMVLGMVRDEQFGPLVMMGLGGVQLEVINDVVYAMPPFDSTTAARLLGSLNHAALFEFDRGAGPPAMAPFYQAAARFSELVAVLGEDIAEIDLNPVLVNPDTCVVLDALIVRAPASNNKSNYTRAQQTGAARQNPESTRKAS